MNALVTAPANRSELLAHDDGLRALARVLTREDAEDHVQDTYVAALSHEAPRSTGPWMRQVLRNNVRDQARRHRRRRELAHYVEQPASGASSELPEAQVAEHEAARLLREVLREVGEPYQEVLELRYFEERSAAEIARELDLPPGTVRWRCSEGLKRMRQALDARSNEQERPWMGMMLAFAGPGVVAEPAKPAASVATGLKLMAVGGLTVAAVLVASMVGFGEGEEPGVRAPVAARVEAAAAPVEADVPAAEEAEVGAPATPAGPGGPAGAPVSAPTRPAAPEAAVEDEVPSVDRRAEARKCMEDAIAAFNAGSEDAPGAVGHLVEAGNCAEDAHAIGYGVQINRTLLERYPDSLYAEDAKASLRRLFASIVDAEAGLDTEWGQDCVAPLEDDRSVEERLVAAQCLTDAAMFGAALEMRQGLLADLAKADLEANAEAMETLEGNIAKYSEMGAEWLKSPEEE